MTFNFFRISIDEYPESNEELVRIMRERKPTLGNREEMLEMMEKTRSERRRWIEDDYPDFTSIITKYPRLSDMNSAVS